MSAEQYEFDHDNAICPYCKAENYVETEDYNSDEREDECRECGKTYLVYQEYTVTHNTRTKQ